MITNNTQLAGALRQIAWAADALEGLRRDVTDETAVIFPVVAEAYLHQIRELAAEARAFLDMPRPREENVSESNPRREKVAA